MEITPDTKVGEIVRENYLAAEIFRKNAIDFCCNGHITIHEVCKEKNINSTDLIKEIAEVCTSGGTPELDFQSWPMNLLADYIQHKHHKYVEQEIPILKTYLSKICDVHGSIHPELLEVNSIFIQAADELTMHMKKEELILFPYIKRLSEANGERASLSAPPFGSVENPINMMKHEHNDEGDYFRKISELTNNYMPPANACNTYKVTFNTLKEFEKDLHKHIHLENNILFPKAIECEKELC